MKNKSDQTGGFFETARGEKIHFADLAARVRLECPSFIGLHIFAQLKALNLTGEFERGTTPCALPFSFSDCEPIDRELMGNLSMLEGCGL